MAEVDGLELITSDEDWLDLRTGESAIVRGKASSTMIKSETSIMVSLPDWSDIVVEVPEGVEKDIARGARVEIVVTRTEDGLEAEPGAIVHKED